MSVRGAVLLAIMTSTWLAGSAIAQDAHAGHAGHEKAAAPDPMAGMDHGAMMHMAPVQKGITRAYPGPAEAALQGFSDALEVGNHALAIERLAANAVIVENGEEESRDAYIGHHLGADISFAKQVKSVLLERRVEPLGKGRARIFSRTRMVSNRSDKPLDMTVSETATMVRAGRDWRIERLVWVTEKP